jgi:hypothetical protein
MDESVENLNSKQDLFWVIFDTIKRDFYDLIRKRIEGFDWKDPKKCMDGFEALFDEIKNKWGFLEEKIGESKSLRGLLYEILFFVMTKRDFEFSTKGLIILGFDSDESEDLLFDVLPIYEPIPELLKKKAPQMRADFIIFSNKYNPLLVEVKSSRPKLSNKIKWTIIGCKWHNCYYYLAYPKEGIEFPTRINDWEFEMLSSPD